jgi:hypothetical protein
MLGRRCYKGDHQPSWSLDVQAQTDCSSYLGGMPCTTQGAMPKQKKQKPPAPSLQSDRGPKGHQTKTPHAQGEAGTTRNAVKRRVRGPPGQTNNVVMPDHRARGF